jgi:glycosyltransferase involved in cell wall biosynthesis
MAKAPFRVLQLIDSLNAGGSERMAVQLANLLSDKIEFSGIVSTRQSGILEKEIYEHVTFLCLNKKSALDLFALKQLFSIIKKHRIDTVHAHGTSFFMAFQVNLLVPSLKLVWHDHYGYRFQTKTKDNKVLIICSKKFDHIITINEKLADWAKGNLKCHKVSCIENFSVKPETESPKMTLLRGQTKDFKIVHVANLRPEKDHITVLKAISLLAEKNLKISYHSIGNFNEKKDYFKEVQNFVNKNKLKNTTYFYGSQSKIYDILHEADLGILSSTSEGFPVTLIEYAMAGLPVVVTDVGDCKKIVGSFGEVVQSKNYLDMSRAIEKNILNPSWSLSQAASLHQRVRKLYDYNNIIDKITDIYSTL